MERRILTSFQTTSSSQRLIGRTVGHYRILGHLGDGGMGVVYRAEDTRLGRVVALKLLPPELTRDPEAKRRFEREARAAALLDHPNICTTYDFGEAEGDGQMYIAMACYEGESLADRVTHGPLSLDDAIKILEQICRGLGKAHASGVIHRDIKPGNVMLTADGVVKIVDFGLAKLSAGSQLTKSRTSLGTAAYMAPEQLRGEEVGPQTDIWASGIVLFELLTGTRPFRGDYAEALSYSILNEQPATITELRPDLPVEIDRIIKKMLRKDPLQRYASTDEVIAELEVLRTPSSGSGKSGPRSTKVREPLRAGAKLGPYEIVEPLGSGGMGDVYRARDTRLDRQVALKVLAPEFSEDAERKQRFQREAKTISSLSHPNICTLFDVGEQEGTDYLVMEYLEGETLAERLARGALPLTELLKTGIQIGEALGRAHQQGIVHRDLKPGNVMLTKSGAVKLLDFGLAKDVGAVTSTPRRRDPQTPDKPLTAEGAIVGTLAYMAPEQVEGREADARSDIFAFGAILYEMATGKRAFEGTTKAKLMAAILEREPPPIADVRTGGDSASGSRRGLAAIDHIVRRCLEKNPARRPSSAEEVQSELKALLTAETPVGRPVRVKRAALAAMVVFGLLALSLAGWFWHRASRERWVRETAIPEIGRLVENEEFDKAAALIREARAILPKDPTLDALWIKATGEASVNSVPPGADVSIRPFHGDANAWESIGKTPFKKIRVPKGAHIWRIAKPGFAVTEFVSRGRLKGTFQLHSEGSVPQGMVPVDGDMTGLNYPYQAAPKVKLDDYLIDRHEVTNEDYKKFVDAAGYQKRDFWEQPFVKDGRTVPWEDAVALFKDTTGRPGPATWEVGSFPKGKEKHPVGGVSWYEAAAYAEFAGKTLPTAYHWTNAAQLNLARLIAPGGNFRSEGTQPVGGPGTLSGSGTTDMAGNVKEWCWNESAAGKRFILGGGFGEPSYVFTQTDTQPPWDRNPNYGFRCVKLLSPAVAEATARLEPMLRDFSREKPVSDETYNAIKGLYSYDKGELNAKIEETATTEEWVWEKVSFDAAYGGERVIVHIFLPKNSSPPFQTVVYFPAANALFEERFDPSLIKHGVDFLPKSGRALVIPVYKGTFERRDGLKQGGPAANPPAAWRDHVIAWSKDLGRSLDYLETRKDVDSTKIGYLGFSLGAANAPVFLAVEERFKVAAFLSGGFYLMKALPEADDITFAPRVKIPVLLLNDRYDDFFPLEASQLPFFRLLGTPNENKRQVFYESGHGGLPLKEAIRETLDWFDKYLGPVNRRRP
jgi:eukaryotic-like serine/threonine-protein kinase